MDGPPPPPPPHGENPHTTEGEYRKSSDLPDGNYDIFIIPPHSAGSGFVYLPSLQCNRNSFLAGVASTLLVMLVWSFISPIVKAWYLATVSSGSGTGMAVLAIGVGLAGWAFGSTQSNRSGAKGNGSARGRFGGGSGGPGGPGGPGNGGPNTNQQSSGANYGGNGAGQQQQQRGGNYGGGQDYGNQYSGNQYRSGPPPNSDDNTREKEEAEKRAREERAKEERAKEERAKEERAKEERAKEERAKERAREERAREERAREERIRTERAKEERAREERAKEERARQERAKEERAREERAKERAREEAERERVKEEARRKEELRRKMDEFKRKRDAEAKEKEKQREREAMEKELKERREQLEKEMAAARAAVEKEAREKLEKEVAEAKAKADRLEAEAKAKAEKLEAEAKERAAKEAAEKEAAAKAAAQKEAMAKFAALKEAASKKYAEKKAEEARQAAAAKSPPPKPASTTNVPRTPSPKKPPHPTAKTADDDAYSFRPYDRPRRPYAAGTSVYSESSYAPSHSTARTTPPPSHRSSYSTKDPDKIVIQGVYAFNNAFMKTPIAQLVSGQGMITDGLVLRITTEGLFIDDDLRGIGQREWDVKAWTLKLAEVWCPQVNATTSAKPASSNPFSFRRGNTVPTNEESEAFLANLLKVCKNKCRLASPSACFARSATDSNTGGPVNAPKAEFHGLHILRASVRDQEGKKYVFVLHDTEAWKVAIGLQRLRAGALVRSLGVSGLPNPECKTMLSSLGYV
ncbi:uncharacterized protein N7529_011556 [Penicillium soppii]|uniref:uncharacterized protein n=1 Tax=Penicillium soppii TaxID=69789 RepID=UPI002546DD8D|nr:uncharacterized protein N7529_011556 [Penicillium soppii]KAJ5852171.1 hypothetical protein N7529_011556 [Penicillium soppii]